MSYSDDMMLRLKVVECIKNLMEVIHPSDKLTIDSLVIFPTKFKLVWLFGWADGLCSIDALLDDLILMLILS